MSDIPEELFQIISSHGRKTLVAAGRLGCNVGLFACTCGSHGTGIGMAPAEARDLAAELIRLADEADAQDGPR